MKYHINIIELKSLTDIPGYWTSEDYINLLEAFDFSDSKDVDPVELRELLEMAISDTEPRESAEILLHYKLGDKLSKGQIKNLSIEMVEDNESEEYPDIALHYPLYCINQLLYKAYNGIFPNAKATKIEFELHFFDKVNIVVTPALALCTMSNILREQNPIIRLYENEISGEKSFEDAEKIVWQLHKNEGNTYTLITSDYWINKEDFCEDEITSSINLYEG